MAVEQEAEKGAPGPRTLLDPTDYRLSGEGLEVSYSATSISGRPLFHYKDATHDLDFVGDQIDRIETPVGTLVTVTIEPNNDAREVRFSLLIPVIKLRSRDDKQRFATFGIETTDRSQSHTLPPGPAGVLQTYRTFKLEGTAELLVS
jgi:hypothetical protein